MVQEHSVPVDPLWDGVAGPDHQTDPLPDGDLREIALLLPPQLQGGSQAPKLEAGPRWRGRAPLPTAGLSGGAWGGHAAFGTLRSGLLLWKGQLVILAYSLHLLSQQ